MSSDKEVLKLEFDRRIKDFESARHAQQRFDHVEAKCVDLFRRFQKAEEDNRKLSAANFSSAQTLSMSRQSMEAPSVEYYREVETLRLS